MSALETKIFQTDESQLSHFFLTDSIQQVCATGAFCGLDELQPIHLNNALEFRIDEAKKKLDTQVLQDCFMVYSLNVPNVLRKIFLFCPLVADTGRLRNSMK
jgi:hypothetical protein